ncbi:MAG TPA: hypothetical protein VIL99_02160 [Ignavibacteria bacterium]
MKTQLIFRENKVFLAAKDKDLYLGTIRDSVFHCKRNSQIHYFRLYTGYGFTSGLLKLEAVEYFHVYIIDENKNLWTSKEIILKHGIKRQFKNYESQYILSLEFFKSNKEEAVKEFLFLKSIERNKVFQESLFSEVS